MQPGEEDDDAEPELLPDDTAMIDHIAHDDDPSQSLGRAAEPDRFQRGC